MSTTTAIVILILLLFSVYVVNKIRLSKKASTSTAYHEGMQHDFPANNTRASTEEQYNWSSIDTEIAKHVDAKQIYRAFGLDYSGELTSIVIDEKNFIHIYSEHYDNGQHEGKAISNIQNKSIIHYSYPLKKIQNCRIERVYLSEYAARQLDPSAQPSCYIIIHLDIEQGSTIKTHSIHFGPEYYGSYAHSFYNKILG